MPGDNTTEEFALAGVIVRIEARFAPCLSPRVRTFPEGLGAVAARSVVDCWAGTDEAGLVLDAPLGVMVRIAARVLGFAAETFPTGAFVALTAAGWESVEFDEADCTELAFDESGVIVLGADRMAGTVAPFVVPGASAFVDECGFG